MTVQRSHFSNLVTRAGLASDWAGSADPEITSIVEDSRQVVPGACFVAVQGSKLDGHAYIESALQAGASAVITEKSFSAPSSVAALQVASARGVAGRLAAVLTGLDALQAQGRFKLVGITGTNGKSTTCYLLRSILRAGGQPAALLGTIQYDLVSRTIDASMTTPPAARLVGYLDEAARAGATHAVMEVSSHALDQGRCDGLRFAVGVFSNLSGDHLDYHGDMDAYLRAKKRLFDALGADAVAVVNHASPYADAMLADCAAYPVRFGMVPADHAGEPDHRLTVWARVLETDATGTRFELALRRDDMPGNGSGTEIRTVRTSLPGRHNVENNLAAAAAALALGVPLNVVVEGLSGLDAVPGRLQRVQPAPDPDGRPAARDVNVLVDYAHTDDALVNVLSALQPLARASGTRLIVLFGCGGDRDRTKRPRMARAAADYADSIVVTSDNPRSEEPTAIIDEIMTGFKPEEHARVRVEPDRRRAIALAIGLAAPGDIVLLAGKGHETYQEIQGQRIDFDDAQVAAEALARVKPELTES